MHKKFVLNIISRILLIVCFVMLAPLGWAFLANPNSREVFVFVATIAFGMTVAGICRVFLRIKKTDYEKMNIKDALAIVGLSWICLSAYGALPLFFSGAVPSFTDAFFEVVSGFTTTGATIITDVEALPRGILFWRSLTHWLGGMGIIVLCLALLPALGQSAFHLYRAEAPGIAVERVEPRIKETAKILWSVYFLLSLAETLLLMFGGMTFYESLCHTFGTMATGGFSTRNASIGAFNAYTQWVITVFMFLAGANFMLHYQALRGNIKSYLKSEEFRAYLGILLVGTIFFSMILFMMGPEPFSFRAAAFQVTSILTTTGYTTVDFDLWPHVLRFGLILLMFIGGCGGSTGGGMKVVRILLTFKMAINSVVQMVFPNAVIPLKCDNNPLPNRQVTTVLSYFIVYILLFFIGSFLFILFERCDLATGFSATIAALSNIGPGLVKVGATQNYAWISIPGKWLLIFLMLAGRLELYAVLILIFPSTWKK